MKDKKFIKLQKKWYDKLKKSGFKDIEYTDSNGEVDVTALAVSDGQLKKIYAKNYDTTAYFYNMLENFLTHNEYWGVKDIEGGTGLDVRDNFIAHKFVQGVSYRKIIKLWKSKFYESRGFTTMVVYSVVKKLVAEVKAWNISNMDGLKHKDKLDELEELGEGNA